jgi:4'-phosphopantetheinyl transferase
MMNMKRDTEWPLLEGAFTLTDDQVHVWRGCLDVVPENVGDIYRTLSEDEKARAERFRFPIDRMRFIVARGLLRAILARYIEQPAHEITFVYGASGKPVLHRRSQCGRDIRFNVSHAEGIALYAIATDRDVGIDIERIRTDFIHSRIAERFFSRREVATLRALEPALQADAFFRCWTRKEAYVKARGTGITVPLDGFDVTLAPGEPAAILAIRDTVDTPAWSMHDLHPSSGYVGAVAVAGTTSTLTCWQCPDPGTQRGSVLDRCRDASIA